MVADAAGVTVWRWDNLEPFGLTGVQTDPDGNGQAFVFNLRFAGQYFDAESGLFHNRHRDYDSASGRYVQADPIGLAGGISLYSYVGANPLGFVDPLGLAAVPLDALGYSTYGLFDAGSEMPFYVGHTNQELDARLGQHRGKGRAGGSTQIRSLTGDPGSLAYTEAKGAEQAFMEKFETKSGGRGNRINAIDKSRTDARGVSHLQSYENRKTELSTNRCE